MRHLRILPSPYRTLVEEWTDCQKCEFGVWARKVYGRGILFPDWLLLGEAPGKSEDALGEPFVGPAGRLLDQALKDAGADDLNVKLYWTNALICRPCDTSQGANRTPFQDELANCKSRLSDMVLKVVRPKVGILCLGNTAWSAAIGAGLQSVCLRLERTWHPSYILRSGGPKSSKYNQFVTEIRNCLEASAHD